MLASALLSFAAAPSLAQSADTATYPEPVLGIRLGWGRQATRSALLAQGWSLVADTIQTVGKPTLYAGAVDGHRAEIVAMFGEDASRDRLIQVAINFPVENEAALASTYAWAYRRMERSRCTANLQADYRAQLDSILHRGRAAIPAADHVGRREPILPGHTTVDPGNIDWPTPVWVTAEALAGTRLDAALLGKESAWPFQVTLWTTAMFAVTNGATLCPDTKALIARQKPVRVVRRAAPGERVVMDTLLVVVGQGITGRVGTQTLDTKSLGPNDEQEHRIVVARGTPVPYAISASPGFEHLMVVVDSEIAEPRGTLTVEGNRSLMMGADPRAIITSEMKPLVDLMRRQLTAKDPLWAFVDVECEVERLYKTLGDAAAQKIIDRAGAVAEDPVRDRKALIRIDDALSGHAFGGCVKDRAKYQATKTP